VPTADLHIHTRCSDGLGTVAQTLEYIEHRTNLEVVAITDHEDAAGGLQARELAATHGYRFEVIVGAEVTTRQGHLLALFIEQAPKSFRSAEATLEAIHSQGGLAIVPHPMSWLTRSLSRRTIDRICERDETGITFDGIELGNPSPAGRLTEAKAVKLNAERWRLPVTGGSDAHHLECIGTGWTEFEGDGVAGLREALIAGTTNVGMTAYPSARAIGLGKVALQLGWGYCATPRKMLSRRAAPVGRT